MSRSAHSSAELVSTSPPDEPIREAMAWGARRPALVATPQDADALAALITATTSRGDLGDVLSAAVELVERSTGCHACVAYVVEGERLRLKAASPAQAHLIGQVTTAQDEGVVGWVARHRVAATVGEELIALPIETSSGVLAGVLLVSGATLRGELLGFLTHGAALLAAAIERDRLRARLAALPSLSRDIAGASRREDLYRVVTRGVRRLMPCESCRLLLRDPESGALELVAADPPASMPDLATVVAVPLIAGEEELGVLGAGGSQLRGNDEEVLRMVADQAAIALARASLIERFGDKCSRRQLFEALAAGDAAAASSHAAKLRLDHARAYVVLHGASTLSDARVSASIRSVAPAAVLDSAEGAIRALVPLFDADPESTDAVLDEMLRAERIVLGRSSARSGFTDARRSLEEAEDAAMIGRVLLPEGGLAAYEHLGAYRYLVRSTAGGLGDRQAEAVGRLAAYDARRKTELVQTLEEYLRSRGSLGDASHRLFIHTNTLRQRLRRIEAIAGFELVTEDLLSLELAIKVRRLRAGAVS